MSEIYSIDEESKNLENEEDQSEMIPELVTNY
jgi:hypothetical protein